MTTTLYGGRDLKTNIRYPWALVYRGGHQDSRRRNTRMAYLKEAVPGTNGSRFRGFLMNHNCTNWTKTLREIDAEDIAFRFSGWHQPQPIAVRRAVQRIPKTSKEAA